jgi:hypothetical protein
MVTKAKAKADSKNIPDSAKSVKGVLETINDEQTIADCKVLVALMKKISGKTPKIWNVGAIGFDSYHYKYESGREGDCHVLGFYPRKGKFTIYLMDGVARHSALLKNLGKHTTSRVCLYFKRLSDLNPEGLEQILKNSYAFLKANDVKKS